MSQVIELSTKPLTLSSGHEDNWKKELANAITSASVLLKRLDLTAHLEITDRQAAFKCLATENYINKMQIGDTTIHYCNRFYPSKKRIINKPSLPEAATRSVTSMP